MWVVADLDEDYIAKMEDVLEVYQQPYDPPGAGGLLGAGFEFAQVAVALALAHSAAKTIHWVMDHL